MKNDISQQQESKINDSAEQKIGTDDHSANWQQLSPIAILYFTASSFKQIFSNAFYLIPVLALNYKSIIQHPYIWIPSILGLVAILIVFAVLSFKVYRFRLTDNNIEIRSGVISKKHLNLPFERVQNVKIEQPLYYRFSGHACLQLDTAGSAKNEAKIIALKLELAEKLKSQILQHTKQSKPIGESKFASSQTSPSNNTTETTLNTRSLSDLIIHGITSNRIWIFLGGLAPFFDDIATHIGDWANKLGMDFKALFSLQTHSMLEVGLYALSLTILIMLILVSFSVIGSIISFYGYTLNKLDDRYIRRSGLLTKHEVSMRLSRLQMVVRKQDWLDLILKRINLKFEQNSSIENSMNASAATNKIIVPSVKLNECQDLIDDAYPQNKLAQLINQQGFISISKRFIARNIVLIWMPIWIVASLICWFNHQAILILITTTLLALFSGLTVLRWRRWGIAQDQNFIYIRKGLIGVDYYCFPTFKVQQTKFLQTELMKRRELASVKFVLASGALKIPLISQELAFGLINDCLFKVESSKKSWM
ncbi:PH domain-containing protein [Paraglaciecola aquimarina]|uniref:PH domain-containing protein n=1 Tax=Paraglaciecola algarum TaxID=3050085 RepID=A0ABS9DB63_9ALTE|nr:PH domain-containing protein [Paraglaciecola sp. G1-23]MCF2950091.1 PH domain-containing protein [Paraglaciecola sp. G1-23]